MPKAPTVLNVVRFLEKCLEENGLNISKIIVFGSRGNGTAREDSDIDIVIVSEDFRGKNILQRVKMTGQPEVLTIRKFLVPLDILTMTPEELESETSPVAGSTSPSLLPPSHSFYSLRSIYYPLSSSLVIPT